MTAFTDPNIQALWYAGKIRAAYHVSSVPQPTTTDHPFRDPVARLDAARRAHEHGTLCWYVAKFDECATALEHARAERTQILGEEHPDTLDTIERLAALAHYQLDPEAPRRFGEVIARLVRVHGPGSVRVAIAERNFAACLRDRGATAEARALIERAGTALMRGLTEDHAEVVAAIKVSAMLHIVAGDPDAALAEARRAVELGGRRWSAQHPFVATAELTIASAELKLDKHRAAGKRLPSVIARIENGFGKGHPLVGLALAKYAEVELAAANNFLRAEELARRAIAVYAETYPKTSQMMTWTLFRILYESGQVLEAGDLVNQVAGDIPRELHLAMSAKLANHLMRMRDYRQAVPWLERTRDLCDDPAVAAEWAAQAERFRREID